MKWTLMAGSALLLLAGCAQLPVAHVREDTQTKHVDLVPSDNPGNYIRDMVFLGSARVSDPCTQHVTIGGVTYAYAYLGDPFVQAVTRVVQESDSVWLETTYPYQKRYFCGRDVVAVEPIPYVERRGPFTVTVSEANRCAFIRTYIAKQRALPHETWERLRFEETERCAFLSEAQ